MNDIPLQTPKNRSQCSSSSMFCIIVRGRPSFMNSYPLMKFVRRGMSPGGGFFLIALLIPSSW